MNRLSRISFFRRFQRRKSTPTTTRAREPFVGPLAQPVWPAWVDAARPPRAEPQRSDPAPRPATLGCGWFDSSHELSGGLLVCERDWSELVRGAADGQWLAA